MTESKTGTSIERVSEPSGGQFASRILPRRTPVIIEGAMEDWPALSKWSVDYLVAMAGSRRVRVTHSPTGVYNSPDYVNMELREFLERISGPAEGDGQFYITGIEIAQALPELAEDVRTPRFLNERSVEIRHLFIGRDTATGCHFHPRHQNVLAQLVGRKRVVLFAPRDFRKLYPKPLRDARFNWSTIDDVRQYDLQRFPRMAGAEPIEVTLGPGAILHIPIHWWHAVYGIGLSISLAFFWRAPLSQWSFPHPGLRSAIRTLVAEGRGLLDRAGLRG